MSDRMCSSWDTKDPERLRRNIIFSLDLNNNISLINNSFLLYYIKKMDRLRRYRITALFSPEIQFIRLSLTYVRKSATGKGQIISIYYDELYYLRGHVSCLTCQETRIRNDIWNANRYDTYERDKNISEFRMIRIKNPTSRARERVESGKKSHLTSSSCKKQKKDIPFLFLGRKFFLDRRAGGT